MPQFLHAESENSSSRSRSRQRAQTTAHEHRSMWDPLRKIGSWLRREDDLPPGEKVDGDVDEEDKEKGRPQSSGGEHQRPSHPHRRGSRRVVPGLPRPLTFKRQNSEKRDRLLPVPVDPGQRRATSADRRTSLLAPVRSLSPPPVSAPSLSAPDVLSPHHSESQHEPHSTVDRGLDSNIPAGARQVDYCINNRMEESLDYMSAGEPPPYPAVRGSFDEKGSLCSASDIDEIMLQEELEAKWILNLSMHFRDMSDREKFFVTYAEEPNKWRRVTVSCDYRELTPDSLESDLKTLRFQRDKSTRIYEAIRDSLPDIQFYDTVTNLKLQTADGRLHVHVTEDINEIIPYPSVSAVEHLECKTFRESDISFDSHISGFVYKVAANHRVYIKKEIPGPDAVEEFLYEINALCNLQDSSSVIQFEGVIVDERSELIKGLLISYAEQGALVDMIYDYKCSDHLPWERRERWARQIVQGLSEIHEAGFVQGDFTLSNIVIDHQDNAKIIDINRRGCPVGWEPPELARLIESGQRISIYIGVKSDLFQLGMVLWALAEQQDEPERQEEPLANTISRHIDVPQYFRDLVKACLSDSPRGRPTAKSLLAKFPEASGSQSKPVDGSRHSVSTHRSDKEYIDPATAVDLDDISKHRHDRSPSSFFNLHMPSTEYAASSGSYILAHHQRGRSPAPRSHSRGHRSGGSPYVRRGSVMSLDDSELENDLASLPASRETRWEQVYEDGDTKFVQRGSHMIDARDFATQEPKDVCITSQSGDLDQSLTASKKSDETSLSLPTAADFQQTQQQRLEDPQKAKAADTNHRQPSNKASFSDRVHHLVQCVGPSQTNNLTDLETEVAMDVSMTSSSSVRRTDTGLSAFERSLLHHDSGFNESMFEAEWTNKNFEDNIAGIRESQDELTVHERLWDQDNNAANIGYGVRGEELLVKPARATNKIAEEAAAEKALEEKVSNTTIRPPSLSIPTFAHAVPEIVDSKFLAIDAGTTTAKGEEMEQKEKRSEHEQAEQDQNDRRARDANESFSNSNI